MRSTFAAGASCVTSRQEPALDAPAADLLLSVVETPDAVIAGQVLDDYYASVGDALKARGLLKPAGAHRASPSFVDHEDEPVELIWSGRHEGYGYFSPAAGWVTVENCRLAMFGVSFDALIRHVLGALDGMNETAIILDPNLLWEVGQVRLPGRAKRVPVWIARRLGEPAVWDKFLDAVRLRPAPGLRIVLTFTSADRLPVRTAHGHEIIAVRDVADSSLTVDADLLAARIAAGTPQSDDAITMAADGAAVSVRGTRYAFPGSKQRAVIRELYGAWKSGNCERLTVEVLESAGYSASVNTLTKAFSGRSDWRDFIKEEHGRCWMFS